MFKKQIQQSTIALENPCTESQDNMLPIAGGQFCNTCQKAVTDFTGFTDEEFIRYFQTHKSSGCGKFKPSQFALTIPERHSRQPFHSIMKPAAALLVSLSLYGWAEARAAEKPAIIQSEPQPDTVGVQTNGSETVKIHGTVFEENGDPATGASIKIKGTREGTMADENGEFQLDMPEGNRMIVISMFGCKDKEAFVGADNIITVHLERSKELGEISVYGGYIALPICVPTGITGNHNNKKQHKPDPKEKVQRTQK